MYAITETMLQRTRWSTCRTRSKRDLVRISRDARNLVLCRLRLLSWGLQALHAGRNHRQFPVLHRMKNQHDHTRRRGVIDERALLQFASQPCSC